MARVKDLRIELQGGGILGGEDYLAQNSHFLILPAYSRYNDQAPLACAKGVKKDLPSDLLYFPLGYSQVISSLRQYTHHKIEVLDINAEGISGEHLERWLSNAYSTRKLPDPDYMLIGGMSTSWPIIKEAVNVIKAVFPKTRIVCGGTIANLHYELLLTRLGIDIAVLGDAEFVIVDLFRNLDNLSQVKGIAYLDRNGKVMLGPASDPPDLNSIPEPAWDLLDTEKYINSEWQRVGYRGLPINTSMGCPYSCNFCYVPGGVGMRYLNVDKIVDRMERMKDKFRLDFVAFYDDILFVNKDWMEELASKLIKAKLGLWWNCCSRVNLFSEKDRSLLGLLRRAGLTRISFGIESGSPIVLKQMGKTGVSPEKARLALRLVREHGIRATASMLLGYPGETPETIWESVKFCKENLLSPSFYLLQPFPGTTVYENYVRPKYDEEEYLDLLTTYRGGEKLILNLTSMPDDELMRHRDVAEREMKKFEFRYYLAYYRGKVFWQGPKDLYMEGKRIFKGRMFSTP